MSRVEILVEEPSMAVALEHLCPKLLAQSTAAIHPHRGKPDLLRKLPNRLQGYAAWLPTDARILIVVDQDQEDCRDLKRRIESMVPPGLRASERQVVVRLAVEELEAWYFGDWKAVCAAYPKVGTTIPRQAAFRDPDAIRGGTWEALERVLQRHGYFRGGLRKTELARTICPHWRPEANRSRSFGVLCETLRQWDAS